MCTILWASSESDSCEVAIEVAVVESGAGAALLAEASYDLWAWVALTTGKGPAN